ncbi:unnamed protein product [Litomosoides sigmodontis]|uniref:Uncharacterized protein n=1 Tax=Litomosoides sigmodontis TaxID=42156 RepID=A0A3P6UR28_LITSI|nr:unnamed protein product [Litomosoides sigmodontis]
MYREPTALRHKIAAVTASVVFSCIVKDDDGDDDNDDDDNNKDATAVPLVALVYRSRCWRLLKTVAVGWWVGGAGGGSDGSSGSNSPVRRAYLTSYHHHPRWSTTNTFARRTSSLGSAMHQRQQQPLVNISCPIPTVVCVCMSVCVYVYAHVSVWKYTRTDKLGYFPLNKKNRLVLEAAAMDTPPLIPPQGKPRVCVYICVCVCMIVECARVAMRCDVSGHRR